VHYAERRKDEKGAQHDKRAKMTGAIASEGFGRPKFGG
jgi:hypothetical protein